MLLNLIGCSPYFQLLSNNQIPKQIPKLCCSDNGSTTGKISQTEFFQIFSIFTKTSVVNCPSSTICENLLLGNLSILNVCEGCLSKDVFRGFCIKLP